MTPEALSQILNQTLADRQLLQHPFYQRWSEGHVTADELRNYAQQYRHFEAAIPGWLRLIHDGATDNTARQEIAQTLADETAENDENALSHLELFEHFARELGVAQDVAPTSAMTQLIATHTKLVQEGAAQGLAGILAYEYQAPAVSAAKAQGLRDFYELSDEALKFWDVHAELDTEHANWTIDAVCRLTEDAAMVQTAIGRAADAWWAFLDECDHILVAV